MRYEEISHQTKLMLADSLKKAMKSKPVSKVTISEIIADCNVNRKTFYYHFEDIYALLKWILEEEAIEIVKSLDMVVDYEEAVMFALDYIDKNHSFLENVYKSLGRDHLKQFFYTDLIGIIRGIVDKTEQMEGLDVEEDFKAFLAATFTEAVAGMLMELISTNEMSNRNKVVAYTSIIMKSSITSSLKAMQSEPKTDRIGSVLL